MNTHAIQKAITQALTHESNRQAVQTLMKEIDQRLDNIRASASKLMPLPPKQRKQLQEVENLVKHMKELEALAFMAN